MADDRSSQQKDAQPHNEAHRNEESASQNPGPPEQQTSDPRTPKDNPQADADAAGAIEKLSQDLVEANNRTLRAQAELENFRKRIRREMEEQQRYAGAPLMRDLLGVVDDLERAIAAVEKSAEKSGDAAGLLQGVKMVEARLRSVLQEHGCQKIDAADTAFDPAQHEAILHQPSDQHEPGSVMQVTQQGYRLHDRVLRPAQVIVAKQPEDSQAQNDPSAESESENSETTS